MKEIGLLKDLQIQEPHSMNTETLSWTQSTFINGAYQRKCFLAGYLHLTCNNDMVFLRLHYSTWIYSHSDRQSFRTTLSGKNKFSSLGRACCRVQGEPFTSQIIYLYSHIFCLWWVTVLLVTLAEKCDL